MEKDGLSTWRTVAIFNFLHDLHVEQLRLFGETGEYDRLELAELHQNLTDQFKNVDFTNETLPLQLSDHNAKQSHRINILQLLCDALLELASVGRLRFVLLALLVLLFGETHDGILAELKASNIRIENG